MIGREPSDLGGGLVFYNYSDANDRVIDYKNELISKETSFTARNNLIVDYNFSGSLRKTKGKTLSNNKLLIDTSLHLINSNAKLMSGPYFFFKLQLV
jgi:hypothetical protein